MPLTDHSDFFASVHESAFNGLVKLIQFQRPALFNYATAAFADPKAQWCHTIAADDRVKRAGNPRFTVQPPIPVFGSPLPIGLNWCLQFTDLQLDMHPNNAITLPPELGRLQPQALALRLKACFALDCPGDEFIRAQLPLVEELAVRERDLGRRFDGVFTPGKDPDPRVPKEPVVPPLQPKRECFCLELFAVLHFEWGPIGTGLPPKPWLKLRLDGLEIVDITPRALENQLECYLRHVLQLSVLPRLSLPIEALVLDIGQQLAKWGLPLGQRVRLEPAPVPAAVPHNPAVESDELRVFVNLVVENI